MLIWIALALGAVFLLMGGMRAFERANVTTIKSFATWVGILGSDPNLEASMRSRYALLASSCLVLAATGCAGISVSSADQRTRAGAAIFCRSPGVRANGTSGLRGACDAANVAGRLFRSVHSATNASVTFS